MEEERVKAAVVDTYAILAMAYGELGGNAEKVLLQIRRGEVVGYLPATVAYELSIHWLRGKIPTLKSLEELKTFITRYFRIVELKLNDYIESAKIKVEGDEMLRGSPELEGRSLSIVDSTIIWLALELNAPIVTGDKDLSHVARRKGVEIIW
ncbi:MAG: PIN domain-containing protein [archaeon YNP-LCB-003-016]|uniref:PIN domain-containing protein n=1 Tax=Candidatus Culexarchaeum yellowstonense TaxID=2928963 RepID=UPI0026EBCCC1|nr:PIN domain-containing protein [Candidatus Culexarchaeum yellowstonense]MCR6691938.1 PIN domain-containing protein [Candidatus Culexarchaeum yellowstonense]